MTCENQKMWQIIPLSEYTLPPEPATQTLRNNFRNIMQRFRFPSLVKPKSKPSEPERELKVLSQDLVEKAVPKPNWYQIYFDTLTESDEKWVNIGNEEASVQVLVEAPGSQLRQNINNWAVYNGWQVIEPPTPQQILNNDHTWLDQWQNDSTTRWVLPSLECCYLRHHKGLNLLRGWVDLTRTLGTGIVVCDSWAWSFLSKTLHLDQVFPYPQTVAPLDAEKLEDWFRQLANQNTYTKYIFQQANSEELICAYSDEDKLKSESNYLNYVAARSRGIPQLAWNIWRRSLLVDDEDDSSTDEAHIERKKIISVQPWDKVELPIVPGYFDIKEAFVLHGLLLHDGLPDQLLPSLLPLMSFEIASIIKRLQRTNLVTDDATCRRVTCLGYPSVREFLASEGFLTDDL